MCKNINVPPWLKSLWNVTPKTMLIVLLGILLVPAMHFLEGTTFNVFLDKKYYWASYAVSFFIILAGLLSLNYQFKKKGDGSKYSPHFISVFLMFIGISASIIVFLWRGDKDSYEEYYWMMVSVITSFFGIGGLLESSTDYYKKVLAFQKVVENQGDKFNELAQNCQNLKTKVEEFAVWREENKVHTISLNVYNMDDYIINLPFLLSQSAFSAENLEVNVENCYTDQKALDEIRENGGIAVVDPYYASVLKEKEFVILSPLVVENPIKCLAKKEQKNQQGNKLVYDASKDSTSGKIFSGKESEHDKLIPLNNFVSELLTEIYKNENDLSKAVEKNDSIKTQKEKLDAYYNITKADNGNNSAKLTEWYEVFIYILSLLPPLLKLQSDQSAGSGEDGLLNKLTAVFKKYSHFYLMEPEITIIKDLLEGSGEYEIEEQKQSEERNIIFTAVITTKDYLRRYPFVVLKFLKALRVGILRCHSVLNEKDSNGNPKHIDYILKELQEKVQGAYAQETYRAAIRAILEHIKQDKNAFDVKNLYPNDLIIFGIGGDIDSFYTARLQKRNSELSNYILSPTAIGNDQDLAKTIRFIQEGLGI